jgi:FG-GAP-like repeat
MTQSQSAYYRTSILLTAICISLTASLSQGQTYTYNHASFVAGSGPAGITTADFNHDGRVDVAVSNYYDNTVSILLGTRGGAFLPKVDYPTGLTPEALLTADFRGNGRTDLAVVNAYDGSATPGSVSILLSNGNGAFKSHVDYPVGNYPVGIAVGDFNGDNKLDLAVVNDYDSTVSILFGKGDGTFQSQIVIPVGMEPTSIGVGDFNGDKKADLVTSNAGGTMTVLLSKGDGTFARVDSPNDITPTNFTELVVSDFNQDHKLDVVISSINGPLMFLQGNGDGSFEPPVAIPGSVPDNLHFLLGADVNHDGKEDVIEEGIGGILFVFESIGDGTFRKPVSVPITAYWTATTFSAADVNGDGKVDLVVADSNNNSVDVLLGAGNGTFAPSTAVVLPATAASPDAALGADFNGDGKMDIAVIATGFPHGEVVARLSEGNGKFGPPIVSHLSGSAINNNDLAWVADFNGDGKTDLMVMDDYSKGFSILLGKGDGSFGPPIDNPISGTESFSLAVADFNGDGKADVAVLVQNSGLDGTLTIYLGKGDGTFQAGAQYAVPPHAMSAVDVNGDHKIDLVLTSFSSSIEVLLGNGDGTFNSPISGPSSTYTYQPVFGDFNQDGKLDIAVGTYSGIAFLAGNGDGTFQSPVYSNPSMQFCCQFVVGDVTGDGKLDLVTNGTSGGLSVILMAGNGDGTFRTPVGLGAPGQVSSGTMVLADFNSDGVSDLALPNQGYYSSSAIALYLSQPTPVVFPSALAFADQPLVRQANRRQ